MYTAILCFCSRAGSSAHVVWCFTAESSEGSCGHDGVNLTRRQLLELLFHVMEFKTVVTRNKTVVTWNSRHGMAHAISDARPRDRAAPAPRKGDAGKKTCGTPGLKKEAHGTPCRGLAELR